MKRNSRFSLALHTLGHMATAPDKRHTSAEIAAHAGTNPVVVRRVLGHLREAGLLSSEKGHAGGWLLTRAPKDITFADVYMALEERLVLEHLEWQDDNCLVENTLHSKITTVMEEVEDTLTKRLATVTIADLAIGHNHQHEHGHEHEHLT